MRTKTIIYKIVCLKSKPSAHDDGKIRWELYPWPDKKLKYHEGETLQTKEVLLPEGVRMGKDLDKDVLIGPDNTILNIEITGLEEPLLTIDGKQTYL